MAAPSVSGEIDQSTESSCYISSSDFSDEESDPQEQITLSILDKLKSPTVRHRIYTESERLSRILHVVKEGAPVHPTLNPRVSALVKG